MTENLLFLSFLGNFSENMQIGKKNISIVLEVV